MRKEEPSNNVKLAATNALLNSLEFTKANFDKEVLPRPPSGSQGLCGSAVKSHALSLSLSADGETLHHAGGV